jgi:hypothetical protein
MQQVPADTLGGPSRIPAWLRVEGSHSPYKGVEVIPATKLDSIREAWAAGDRLGALRIAARFFDRSGATKAFKRGMDAHKQLSATWEGSGFAAQNRAGIASPQIQFVTVFLSSIPLRILSYRIRACLQLSKIVVAASCTPARKFLASLS